MMKSLFNYNNSTFQPEMLTDDDYDKIFTKEAAKHSSFQELERNTDERLLSELNKWANRIALDRNKLRTLFNEKTSVNS